jgi:CubicO group peptidase (beta-lactamase class C family)
MEIYGHDQRHKISHAHPRCAIDCLRSCRSSVRRISAAARRSLGRTGRHGGDEETLSPLFGPLGIRTQRWDTDQQGYYKGAADLYLTTRDMARFGFLYLNAGHWEGKQIVPVEWMWESLRPHAAKDPFWADYGYQWWIGQDEELPAFFASGYGDQMIHIVPKLDLVVVVTSTINDSRNDVVLHILEHVLHAVREGNGRNRPAR